MDLSYLPSSVRAILFTCRGCFSAPSFSNFAAFFVGWALCPSRHWLSRTVQAARAMGFGKHHSVLYRFFSRARWALDAVGQALVLLLLPLAHGQVLLLVDDTLCRRTGPHIFGAAMHVDVSRSRAYGPRRGRRVHFSYGHSWVILALWLPLPWDPQRGIALPVLFRLYRGKKRCPPSQYRKRTELAEEMVRLVVSWLPSGCAVSLAADREYACTTVLRHLPPRVRFTGPIPLDAALFDLPRIHRGRGRPATKGPRLPTPADLAPKGPWRSVTVSLYGRPVSLHVFTRPCLWYSVTRGRPVRLLVTHDPKGHFRDRAFLTTDLDRPVEDLLQEIAHRWTLEVAFRDAKQILGIQDPQNGWFRRPSADHRPRRDRAASQARAAPAAQRTLPMAFLVYTLVVAWYVRRGVHRRDLQLVRALRPWDRQKQRPSFADMLSALQRELWNGHFQREVRSSRLRMKILALLPLGLGAA